MFVSVLAAAAISAVVADGALIVFPNMDTRAVFTTGAHISALPVKSVDASPFRIGNALYVADSSNGVLFYDPALGQWKPTDLFDTPPPPGFSVAASSTEFLILSYPSGHSIAYTRTGASLFTASTNVPRIGPCATMGIVSDTKVVVVGGDTAQRSCQVLDVVTAESQDMMRAPIALCSCRSCMWNGKLVVVEYRLSGAQFHVFDVNADQWTQLPDFDARGRVIAFVDDECLHIVANTGPLAGNVWRYSETSQSWEDMLGEKFHDSVMGWKTNLIVMPDVLSAPASPSQLPEPVAVIFTDLRPWSLTIPADGEPIFTRLKSLRAPGPGTLATVLDGALVVLDANHTLRRYDVTQGKFVRVPVNAPIPAPTSCLLSTASRLIVGSGADQFRFIDLRPEGVARVAPFLRHLPRRSLPSIGIVGTQLIVAGGTYDDNFVSAEVHSLDLSKSDAEWVPKTPLSPPIFDAATVAWGDNLVLMGGRRDVSRRGRSRSVYVYNVVEDSWIVMASIPVRDKTIEHVFPFVLGADLFAVVVARDESIVYRYGFDMRNDWGQPIVTVPNHIRPRAVAVVPKEVTDAMAAHVPPPVVLFDPDRDLRPSRTPSKDLDWERTSSRSAQSRNADWERHSRPSREPLIDLYVGPESLTTRRTISRSKEPGPSEYRVFPANMLVESAGPGVQIAIDDAGYMLAYDPNAGLISRFMPGGQWQDNRDTSIGPVRGATFGFVGRHVVLTGGVKPDGYPSTKTLLVDPGTGKARDSKGLSKAYAFSATFRTDTRDVMMVGSGVDNTQFVKSCHLFESVARGSLVIIKVADFPEAVRGASTCVWRNNVLVVGGQMESGEVMHQPYWWDAHSDAWRMLPQPVPGANRQLVPYTDDTRNRLFVIAMTTGVHCDVYEYDDKSCGAWQLRASFNLLAHTDFFLVKQVPESLRDLLTPIREDAGLSLGRLRVPHHDQTEMQWSKMKRKRMDLKSTFRALKLTKE
ncbi:Kelch motif [Plasmodiophora brassicae]